MLNSKKNYIRFRVMIGNRNSRYTDYTIDGHKLESETTPAVVPLFGKCESIEITIIKNSFALDFVVNDLDDYRYSLIEGPLEKLASLTVSDIGHRFDTIDLGLDIFEPSNFSAIQHIGKKVHSLYQSQIVQKYVKSRKLISKRRPVKAVSLKITKLFSLDEYNELISRFDAYTDLEDIPEKQKGSYDVVVYLEMPANDYGDSPEVFLPLTKEEFEELKRFVTEAEQRKMVSKLSKPISRLT